MNLQQLMAIKERILILEEKVAELEAKANAAAFEPKRGPGRPPKQQEQVN